MSSVRVLHKTLRKEVSRRSRAVDVKEMDKKCDVVLLINLSFVCVVFFVIVAVAIVVA